MENRRGLRPPAAVMSFGRLAAVLGLIVTIAVGSAASQGSASRLAPDQQQVLDLQLAWVDAALRGDADAFAQFMDDDFKVVGRAGSVRSKADWVGEIRSKQRTYSSVEYRNVTVSIYGEIAVLSAEYSQRATVGNQANTGTGVTAATWVKRDGRWRVLASIYPGTVQQTK